jgi:hypothetical protein
MELFIYFICRMCTCARVYTYSVYTHEDSMCRVHVHTAYTHTDKILMCVQTHVICVLYL